MQKILFNEINDRERFATEREIVESTTHVVLKDGEFDACGLVVRSDGNEMDVDNSDGHDVTVGETGGGKTRRQILPMVRSMILAGASFIVNDLKGEIKRHTMELLKKKGYRVFVLNFRNPRQGNQYNILMEGAKLYKAGRISEAIESFYSFANSLYEPTKSEKDPYWTLESSRYLTGLCIIACDLLDLEDINLENVYNIHTLGMEKMGCGTYLKQYFTEERKMSDVWKLVEGTITAPNDTQASILSVMSQGLSRLILNHDVMDMMSASDFEVESIGKEKTAVFLITKDETSMYDPIVSSFIDQAYSSLVGMAENLYEGKLPQRVEFVMDEFANMAKINDMSKKITASRSRGIRWHLVVQSLEQLTALYGKADASTILGNCGTWCYMNSSDISLLKIISERCGEFEDDDLLMKRSLLSVEKLQHFSKNEGECLILLGRNRPYITYLPDISEYEKEQLEINNHVEREIKEKRPLFDIRKFVNDEREKKINECLEKNQEDENSNLPFGEMNPMSPIIDEQRRKELIKKIEELEKENIEDEEIETYENSFSKDELHLKFSKDFLRQLSSLILTELLSPTEVRSFLNILLLLGIGGKYAVADENEEKITYHAFDDLEVRGRRLCFLTGETKSEFDVSYTNILDIMTEEEKLRYVIKMMNGNNLYVQIDLKHECTIRDTFFLSQIMLEKIRRDKEQTYMKKLKELSSIVDSLGYSFLINTEIEE